MQKTRAMHQYCKAPRITAGLGVTKTYADIGRYRTSCLERSPSRVLVVEETDSHSACRDNSCTLVPHLVIVLSKLRFIWCNVET